MGATYKSSESERRQVTVMFADISGFTAMSEKMDAEEVTSIMNDCFGILGPIVERHEGTIDKFIGDCIMVLFGAPVAIEEAPRKAVNTAIEIRNRLYQFNKEKSLKIPLDIHIGINTGMVVSGEVGSDEKQEYTVMGDTVNLASRLEEVSGKGQIYVGPSTYRYTKDDFEYHPLEPMKVRGRKKPVSVYELLSRKEKIHRARLGSERMIYSEMVGRDKELNKLELHVLKAIDGEGSIASIIGEAGIGKSRFITELRAKVDTKKVAFLEGRSISTGRNLPFHPIIDILKHWARIKEEDTSFDLINKLEAAIRRVDPEAISEILPFVATLMGLRLTGRYAERVKGIEGEALEKLILKNIKDLIAKSAGYGPIVYVLEDLHWADQSSIELLESIYHLAVDYGILYINVFRPGYEETTKRLLKNIDEKYHDFHTKIELIPLDDSQCEILINNLLKVKGFPAHISALITKKAEGNPFFIEEIGRSFIDEGMVLMEDGHFVVTEKINTVVIPETITDVLMSRIDRLDEQTKSLLKVASVIGRNFFYKILADVAKTIKKIDDKLEYLKEIQLILEKKRIEEIEYLFKHALSQVVTYESILLKERKELHLRVAAAIEVVFSYQLRNFYGMLALHYSKGENLEKAENYLIKAGEEALKVAASSEALIYFQEALTLYLKKHGDTCDPEKIANLEKSIAIALYNKGQYVDAVFYFDRVLKYFGELLPTNKLLLLLIVFVKLLSVLQNLYFPSWRRKNLPSELDNKFINLVYKRGTALASIDVARFFMDSVGTIKKLNKLDLNKVDNGAIIYAASSGLFSVSGISFKISRKILDYAKHYVDVNDKKSIFVYDVYELIHDFLSGNWPKELKYKLEFIDYILKFGKLFTSTIYIAWNALIKVEQGKFRDASLLGGKLFEVGEQFDHNAIIARKYSFKTILLLKRRKLYEAQNEANEGIAFTKKTGQVHYMIGILGTKINIQIRINNIKEAEKLIKEAQLHISNEKRISPFYICHFLLSQFLYDIHMFEEANKLHYKKREKEKQKNAYYSAKKAYNNSMKYAANKTEVFRLIGIFYWLSLKQRKALKWFRKSLKIGEHLDARLELSRTYMEVGKRLLEPQSKYKVLNGIKATEYLENARTMFEEMELEWDLNELDKLEY